MTEKEKMLKGILYDANNDEVLIQERNACKDKCYEFNHLKFTDGKEQEQIIKTLFGKTKTNFSILAPFWWTMDII